MAWFYVIVLFAVANCAPSESEKDKKDLASAETRVGPILPIAGYGGIEPIGAYGPEELGAGVYGPAYGGLIKKPLGYVNDYNGGYLRSGINEGGLSLGNRGSNFYRGGNDGQYSDGLYHEGGNLQNGGYQGVEGYKDDKHHLADDYNSKAFYNGVQGSRRDLGNGQVFDKSQGYAQNAYNTLGDNELSGHKKGHHKTGFKKSYHKDETGQDETFYDTDHDEGNHEIGKKYGDLSGINYESRVNDGRRFNEFDSQDRGLDGYEGNGKLVALNRGLKDYYGRNGYYNNNNKYGSLGGGQASNYGKYGSQLGYQNGFNNGRNLEDFRGSSYGAGFRGPYGYGY